ncbi:NAD(P)-dependent oxidoreductase [Bacillus massiliigorillae]|uniref:NAD(P)-dependent oxidoreductase n=1 Tax=Bacillus massiliigorillae TaxID=1243664 RepID=UPI001E37504E|nr:NAD(P)-dependent oxidoreductase [Bacillus massiliigorillae]
MKKRGGMMGKVTKEMVIGFIGTGVMGRSMALNIMNAGYKLAVYTRTKEKAQELLDKGANWVESPKELASQADVIITIVGYPHDVEEIYLGEEGLIPNGRPGTYLIDMTTSKPSLAKKIYIEANKKDMKALDAPVSGGDIGAKEARLAIMVGGEEEAFNDVKPVLEAMGTNIVLQGPAGSGQHTKMCNQIVIASNMIGVCEAIVYAEKAGLQPDRVLQSISTGAAASWSLSNLAPRILEDDYSPGFFVKHFIKDMQIALEEAEAMDMETPGLSLSKRMYEEIEKKGEENSGTQALRKYWDK